jgi:recombination protein RecT
MTSSPFLQINRHDTIESVSLTEALRGRRDNLAKIIPAGMDVDRFILLAIDAYNANPKLAQCQPLSVLRSIRCAAELGLAIAGPMGEGWLVPFYNKQQKMYLCQFLPGYKGLARLALQHPDVLSIEAKVVRKRDVFEWDEGTISEIRHKPFGDAEAGGPITYAYCMTRLAMPGNAWHTTFTVATRSEIDVVRAMSEQADGLAWVHFEQEMSRKVVTKRHLKYVPRRIELDKALAIDNEWWKQMVGQAEQEGLPEPIMEPSAPSGVSKTQQLTDRLKAGRSTPKPPPEQAHG